jgi:hypothetical protein
MYDVIPCTFRCRKLALFQRSHTKTWWYGKSCCPYTRKIGITLPNVSIDLKFLFKFWSTPSGAVDDSGLLGCYVTSRHGFKTETTSIFNSPACEAIFNCFEKKGRMRDFSFTWKFVQYFCPSSDKIRTAPQDLIQTSQVHSWWNLFQLFSIYFMGTYRQTCW